MLVSLPVVVLLAVRLAATATLVSLFPGLMVSTSGAGGNRKKEKKKDRQKDAATVTVRVIKHTERNAETGLSRGMFWRLSLFREAV